MILPGRPNPDKLELTIESSLPDRLFLLLLLARFKNCGIVENILD
jgi:hypothetical protein